MKVIGTGLSGLVGSRIVELLKDKHEFINLSTTTGFDITDRQSILSFFNSSDAEVVIHLAAKTDVDGCEKDKEVDARIISLPVDQREQEFKTKKTAWGLNVLGTENVSVAAEQTGKRLILISTDFVFDGEKKESYVEDDLQNPINWYGKTKYEGEKIVQSLKTSWAILRIAYPFRAHFKKKDFIRVLIDKLNVDEKLKVISDQILTPTFIDDLAPVFEYFILNKTNGIFHATGNDNVSPIEIIETISKVFELDVGNIEKITGDEYFNGRAKRPFHLALKNDKIKRLGIKMRGIEESLFEIKRQL